MLKFEKAIQVADEELSKAIYNGQYNEHMGIRRINRSKADWLAPVVYLAKRGLEKMKQEENDGR